MLVQLRSSGGAVGLRGSRHTTQKPYPPYRRLGTSLVPIRVCVCVCVCVCELGRTQPFQFSYLRILHSRLHTYPAVDLLYIFVKAGVSGKNHHKTTAA